MGIETNQDEARGGSRRLWLVRHGSTLWNKHQRFCGHSDIPLAPEGRAQAHWLAECLAAAPISALYSSDLLRARETAEIIAEARSQPLQVKIQAGWREIDFGAWEGLTYAEIVAQFPAHLGFFSDPENCSPPGGESLAHLCQRVLTALAQTVEGDGRAEDGDVVIVSHGGPLRVVLSSVLGMPLARQWQFALEPGSLSALDLLPSQDPAAPLGTLALLNANRDLAFMISPRVSKGDE
jgi:alpha-ribazole phosphatase